MFKPGKSGWLVLRLSEDDTKCLKLEDGSLYRFRAFRNPGPGRVQLKVSQVPTSASAGQLTLYGMTSGGTHICYDMRKYLLITEPGTYYVGARRV